MENVLVTGCSFTIDDYKPIIDPYESRLRDKFTSWPHLINPDWKIINIAESGLSLIHI